MEHSTNCREQFTEERARLLAALGEITAGGIIESSQHVGATSWPDAPEDATIDLALAVWPFPLEPARQAALEALGYTPLPTGEDAKVLRFRHRSGRWQVHVLTVGSREWADYVVLNEYLQADQTARQRYRAWRASLTAIEDAGKAKATYFMHLMPAANAWWIEQHGFAPLQAIVVELAGFERPWYISSGWALDLYLSRVTRVHHDVDVVIARHDQLALQKYMMARGWQFVTPLQGNLEPWPQHMRIELPRHQVHAHREGAFIDFLLTDLADGIWRYRRDPLIIRHGERMSLTTAEGIRYLAPELVLLYKSRNTSDQERSKDQHDFEQVYPHLEPERRAWLRWALLATNPQHEWLAEL
jgi:GrpB-like predicted nucleotidyltransferase (UPF0157 family)